MGNKKNISQLKFLFILGVFISLFSIGGVSALCSKNSDCGTDGFVPSPWCSGNNVYQNYATWLCSNPGTTSSSCSYSLAYKLLQNCGSGKTCSNGQCIGPQVKCSKNIDCGTDGFVPSPWCSGNNVYQNYATWTCSNLGTTSSSCSYSLAYKMIKSCASGQTCSNGQCTSPQVKCSKNIDCGTDGFVPSPWCSENNVYQNYATWTCSNPGTTSSSCSYSLAYKMIQACTSSRTCLNGQCTGPQIKCTKNSDCGTNGLVPSPWCSGNSVYQNYATWLCSNPGTIISSCSYKLQYQSIKNCAVGETCSNGQCTVQPAIKCFKNSDCGTDGLVPSPWCSDNNVYQNYATWTCSNPGTTSSSCSYLLAYKLLEYCGSVPCSNGKCIRPATDFVKRVGNQFYYKGVPFYFAGANAYYLWYGNWDCLAGYDANQGCSKEILNDAKAMNLDVLRVWGFSDGTSNYWGQLQPQKGVYDENNFKKFDRMIKEAGDRNIKLIIPLVNNWNDFGGMAQYNSWCGVTNHDDFYTNSCTKTAYKNYVNYVLNRVNSLTGVRYKDDPIIMAWELANEPRAESDSSGAIVDNWIEEMSNYVKSIDKNHLLSVGEEGWDGKGTNYINNHNHANIDFAAFHLFPDNWGFSDTQSMDWISSHISDGKNLGKPVILEEVGKISSRDSFFNSVYNLLEQNDINGDLFWMLKDKNYPDFDNYGVNYPEDSVCSRITQHANFMRAKNYVPGGSQINWLKAQQDKFSTGLVDSYDKDNANNAYTYDQALAAIAFTNHGDLDRAKKILNKMSVLQGFDGQWFDCYDGSNGNVCSSSSRYDTGPIAWMVIAINYYEYKTKDKTYATNAVKALGWLNSLMYTNSADERYGAIKFCSGASCNLPDTISTEHNLDCYSAFLGRGKLSGTASYFDKAALIRDYLVREMWAPSPTSDGPYHNVNVFWVGYKDYSWCTDVQTWGVLSLGNNGPSGINGALEWLYYNPYGSTRNTQDYSSSITAVDGFKSCTGEPTNYIWVEGTEGAASAFYSINDNTRGDYFHNQTKRIPLSNGGNIYSFSQTNPGTIRYSENWRYGSIAASAWFYFNEKKINPFYIPDSSNSYSVQKVNVGNTVENRFYYGTRHFMTILSDANGAIAIRPHPGLDANGWGSSLYLQPFLPGAVLRGTSLSSITTSSNGIKVVASGIVSQGSSGSYGNWNSDYTFNFNPVNKEINGNGNYNINLAGALSSSTGDLNLYKLASNYLVNVPLLSGGYGDTGDMKYAGVTGAPFDFTWIPKSGNTFPGDYRNPISIEAVGDYNQVDTAKQGYSPIAAAYKPSIKVVLSSSQTNLPLIFGAVYNSAESQQFWSDNVGITPLILKSSPHTSYSFNINFNSKAIAGDH